MPNRPSLYIPAVIMLGVISQVGQVLLVRELLMVFHGNELSIGLILASWLIWIGIGSRLAGAIVGRFKNAFDLIKWSSITILFLLPATLFLIRNLRGFFDILPGAYLTLVDMAFSSFFVMGPVCLIFGAQFVFLARAWREHLQTEASTNTSSTAGLEKTYIWEAGGNMLGGILFTFLMVQYLNTFQSAVLVSVIMLIIVLLLKHFHSLEKKSLYESPARTKFNRLKFLLPGILIIAILLFPALEYLDDWAHRLQWQDFALEHQLLETHQSKHGTISVAKYRDQYSFFQSGHLLFSTAGPDIELPGLEEQEAVDFAHLAMVQHENPENILLIGGGLRGTLGEILAHPVEEVDYVERDDVLIEAAEPFLPERTKNALDDPRVNVVHGDGRLMVKMTEEKYDMIIVDVPEPVTADINRYYTREFFQEVKQGLKPEGVFVTSVRSTPDLRGTAIANRNATIYHTLSQVFTRVLPAGEEFMMFFASDSPEQVSVSASELEQRFHETNIQSHEFSPHRYHSLLEKSQLQRVNWQVRNHGRSPEAHFHGPGGTPVLPGSITEQIQAEAELPPVNENYFINSDFKPIGYFYSLLFWEALTREAPAFSLKGLLHVEPWWVMPFIIIPVIGTIGLKKLQLNSKTKAVSQQDKSTSHLAQNFSLRFTVFTTGLSTMALQIALLFSFQSVYGFVYEMVGLITAMFMCGLAVGAYLSHRYIETKVNVHLLAGMQLLMAILAALISIFLPAAAGLQSPNLIFAIFTLLTFTAGLINGIDFPLAAACYNAINKNTDRASGIVYGTEVLGACVGAVLASAVVAPVLGIAACCLLASIASGTAALVLFIIRGGMPDEIDERLE